MKKHMSTIILVLVFIIGLSLLLYPTVSDYWNSFHATQAVVNYSSEVADIPDEDYQKIIEEVKDYNTRASGPRVLSEKEKQEYMSLLNIDGSGMMGYIEIPVIHIQLPIYHSVDESVLQIGAGHVEGSSLPIGGEGTHTVLSGHRGVPSARLFTALDKLTEGDTFRLLILDDVLTYEVDQIRIVLPNETKDLRIVPGMDYCTLVTCTPYGVNTHRLLVRGHRVKTPDDGSRITADAFKIDTVIAAPFYAMPVLIVLLAYLMIKYRRKK